MNMNTRAAARLAPVDEDGSARNDDRCSSSSPSSSPGSFAYDFPADAYPRSPRARMKLKTDFPDRISWPGIVAENCRQNAAGVLCPTII